MAQVIKALAAKPDGLSSIPRSKDGRTDLWMLSSALLCTLACAHVAQIINVLFCAFRERKNYP